MGDENTILFFTSNKGKIAEAKAILKPYGINVEPFDSLIEINEIQSANLEDVAADKLTKAIANNHSRNILAVMVEDAGFFIDEFEGFPGVYSSYVHKTLGINGVLRSLVGIENRCASFRCVIGMHIGRRNLFFTGECKGTVSSEVRGKNGFGYDPIFIPNEGDGRTFAEMNLEEKGQISHRTKAIDAFKAHFDEFKQSPTSNHRNGS
ncbi:MAG: non-canonical purine NTP pyrophosphatase, RdgB/HAM1 family [Euryarchaeota archaeon]|nr:non-canonical purine NTP pyrophosphatase, RdgB/HAM1 family [Euryarchaeota archaeon]|tara:strand:+ start:2418 stop:3038 length:621 start_codon:yes stop_codon:yes gene_type:complete